MKLAGQCGVFLNTRSPSQKCHSSHFHQPKPAGSEPLLASFAASTLTESNMQVSPAVISELSNLTPLTKYTYKYAATGTML